MSYLRSTPCVFCPVFLFYLVSSHSNMATHYDMMRHGAGIMLGQISKLKRNSVRLSFNFFPVGNGAGFKRECLRFS